MKRKCIYCKRDMDGSGSYGAVCVPSVLWTNTCKGCEQCGQAAATLGALRMQTGSMLAAVESEFRSWNEAENRVLQQAFELLGTLEPFK